MRGDGRLVCGGTRAVRRRTAWVGARAIVCGHAGNVARGGEAEADRGGRPDGSRRPGDGDHASHHCQRFRAAPPRWSDDGAHVCCAGPRSCSSCTCISGRTTPACNDEGEQCDLGAHMALHKPARPGAVRFGEAENPGPQHVVESGTARFRNPHQEGFHGAQMRIADGEHDGRATQDHMVGLSVVTCNATAWGPLSRFLSSTAADIVLAQEHHLGPHEVAARSAWALRAGWHSVIAPAERGTGDGWRAGVAIFARPAMGLSHPRAGGHVVVPHRAVAACVQPPGHRTTTVVSLYLHDGKGVSADNLDIVAQVGTFLDMQGDQVPYIVGGDFQSRPQDIAATGMAAKMGGEIVASGSKRGTCRMPRTASEIDYFIIQKMLAVAVQSVSTVEGAGTRPHVPVCVSFIPRPVAARALVLRLPPKLGTERLFGPLPPPPCWTEVADEIRGLRDEVRAVGFCMSEDFRDRYEGAYARWADLAEHEVDGATVDACSLPKLGTRGRRPQLKWRSILPERPPPPPAGLDAQHTQWRDFACLVGELRRAVWAHGMSADGDAVAHDDEADLELRLEHMDDTIGALGCIMEQLRALGPAFGTDGDGATSGDDAAAARRLERSEVLVRLRALAGRVDGTIRAAAARMRVTHGPVDVDFGDVDAQLGDLAERVEVQLNDVAAAARNHHRRSWRDWILTNINSGARNAHRFLRLPEEWRPTTVIDPDGVVTAAPMDILDAHATKYDGLWNGGADPPSSAGNAKPWQKGGHQPLQRPTPNDIREAAKTFAADTAVAFDGFAPRHYCWLSDGALEALADVIEITERTGELPQQLRTLAMPLLPKPRGGHRAIATFVSLYRLWCRLRRDMVRAWEDTVDRSFFAAGSGRTPHDAVWRQAARAEAAVAGSQASATVLWDLAAFFESVKRLPLWQRARRLGFPPTIAAVAFNAYGATRFLSLAGALSRPLDATDGIPAGCGFAMALTKAYCVEAFDRAVDVFQEVARTPPLLNVYVDDIALSAEGTEAEVREALGQAFDVLRHEVETSLRCKVELNKAAIVSSSPTLLRSLRAVYGKYAGPGDETGTIGGTAVPNLGTDFAAGRRRGTHGKMSKRRCRLGKLARQAARAVRLRTVAGAKKPTIFVSGPIAAATYGAAVNGLSDAEVLRIRRAAAHAYTPRARGRSLRRLLLIRGVPTWRAEVETVLQYAKEVWGAVLLGPCRPRDGRLTLPQIDKLWRAVPTKELFAEDGVRRVWNAARGPIAAAHLTLHRIGWSMKTAFVVTTDLGDDITLTKTSPQLLAHMLREAVGRSVQRQVGGALADRGDETFRGRRAAAEHILAQLKADRKMGPADRAAYMSVACEAVMTHDRAARSGYVVCNACPKCGKGPDTIFHRVWLCQAADVVAARDAVAPPWLRREAERAEHGATRTFWVTGIVPHPADVWPRPADDADAECEWHGMGPPPADARDKDGRPRVSGRMYIDGSCTANIFAELRRAGSSIVQWAQDDERGWTVTYPVPRSYPQTPQAGEYLALGLARQLADKTRYADVASDCANVVRDANVSRLAAVSARRMYAAVNRENLSDVDWRRIALVRKVPAHVMPAAAPPGREREDAIGNDKADAAAKAAVGRHPQPLPTMEAELNASLRRARLIVRTIAAVTQCFDPMPKERMVRPPPPSEGACVGVQGGHSWAYEAGLWRCTSCLKLTIEQHLHARHLRERCRGPKASLEANTIAQRGHILAKSAGGLAVIFCIKCGSFAARRAYGLASHCPGRPTPAGKQALARIHKGLQPWMARGPGACRRLLNQRPQAWDERRETFVDIGPVIGGPRRMRSAQRADDGASAIADSLGGRVDEEGDDAQRICKRRRRLPDGDIPLAEGADQALGNDEIERIRASLHADVDVFGGDMELGRGGTLRRRDSEHEEDMDECAHGRGDVKRARMVRQVGTGVEADDAFQSVAAACEGPRGAAVTGVTAATVPPFWAAAVAAVAREASVTALQSSEEDARRAHARRGKVTVHPADGIAAPSDDTKDVVVKPMGRESTTHSQALPHRASGGSPRGRRRSYSPLRAPENLGAGPSTQGQDDKPQDGMPPHKRRKERRRVGSSDASAASSAARGCDVAAECGIWHEPQGGSRYHVQTAQQTECEANAPGTSSGSGGCPLARIGGESGRCGHGYRGGGRSQAEEEGGIGNRLAEAGTGQYPLHHHPSPHRNVRADGHSVPRLSGHAHDVYPDPRAAATLDKEQEGLRTEAGPAVARAGDHLLRLSPRLHGREFPHGDRGYHRHGEPHWPHQPSDDDREMQHGVDGPAVDRAPSGRQRHRGGLNVGTGRDSVPKLRRDTDRGPRSEMIDGRCSVEYVARQSTLGESGAPAPAAPSRLHGRDVRGGRLSPRRDGRPTRAGVPVKRSRDTGQLCSANGYAQGEQTADTPIWCRRPQWMYLPHQGDDVDDYAAKRRRAGPAAADAAAPNAVVVPDPGQLQRRQGNAEPVGAEDAEQLGYREHEVGDRAFGIRGQRPMPGVLAGVADDVHGAPISARAGVSGERVSGARGAAQLRLDARNAHLQRSFQDHAERVARRDACGRGPATSPSAADRMEAIRQRVAARQRGSRPPQQDAMGSSTCVGPGSPTTEVAKMHYDWPSTSRSPAAVWAAAPVVSRSARSGASIGNDTADAATRAAQHGVERPPGGG